MSNVSMTGLLLSEEDKIRTELQADATVDRSRKQTVARLADVYDRMLLRYNASNADDRRRQALADSEAAAVRDMLDLLLAGTAKKEIEKRRVRSGALICLLLSVIFGLITALLIRENYIAGCLSTAVAALFAFLSGRLWYGEREVRVRSELDPNIVWNTVRKSTETMDRKIEEFLAQEDARIEELTVAGPQSAGMLSRDSVKLIGDLMEALYAENGEYALRQLKKLLPWLHQMGIETVDYSPETRELFELLPTKRESGTQRPALLSGDTLLLPGKATETIV